MKIELLFLKLLRGCLDEKAKLLLQPFGVFVGFYSVLMPGGL